jgi:hypothetical protein
MNVLDMRAQGKLVVAWKTYPKSIGVCDRCAEGNVYIGVRFEQALENAPLCCDDVGVRPSLDLRFRPIDLKNLLVISRKAF